MKCSRPFSSSNRHSLMVMPATIANEIILSGGAYSRSLGAGANLSDAIDATSSFATGRADTTAEILRGALSAQGTLESGFRENSAALNDANRLSDIYSLHGTGNDLFVLQLSITGQDADSYLGSATDFHLGYYGVDMATGAVWAVLNHNSDFAVVPEPGTSALLMTGFGALLFSGRCRTQNSRGIRSA